MKLTLTPALLVFALVIAGCGEQNLSTPNNFNQITVIIKNLPTRNMTLTATGGGAVDFFNPEIRITDGDNMQILQLNNIPDTLVFKTDRDYVVVQHLCNPAEYWDYVIAKGDTVVFTYAQGLPMAETRGGKAGEFSNRMNTELMKKGWSGRVLSPLCIYYNQEFGSKGFMPKKENLYYDEAVRYLSLQKHIVDSLCKRIQIPEQVNKYYSNKAIFDSVSLTLFQKKISLEEYRPYIKMWDSLGCGRYTYGWDFLTSAINVHIYSNAPLVSQGNRSFIDHRGVFNLVMNNSSLKGEGKFLLLRRELDRISEQFPESVFRCYYEKLLTIVSDTIAKEALKERYFLFFDSSVSDTSALYLVNLNKQRSNFTEFLHKNKGHVVYVDLWASWCSPCLESLPASVLLRKEYRSKDVVFVYLSTDKNFKQWKDCCQREDLDGAINSFLIINQNTSKLFRSLGINSIPRYLLFSKEGKLVHANAPDPEGAAIRKELDRLLK